MAGTGGQSALEPHEHPLLPPEEGLLDCNNTTSPPMPFSSDWWSGAAVTLAGACLAAISLVLLYYHARVAWALAVDAPGGYHSFTDILSRFFTIAVIAAGPSFGLAIGAWVLRRGATAMGGWRAAAPVVVCGAVATGLLVFAMNALPGLILVTSALTYIVDCIAAIWLGWLRWGPWGAGATALLLVAVAMTFYEQLGLPFG